ncbi:MAG: hypothetical protein ACO1NZ_10820 [Adhaeribacter sp.]
MDILELVYEYIGTRIFSGTAKSFQPEQLTFRIKLGKIGIIGPPGSDGDAVYRQFTGKITGDINIVELIHTQAKYITKKTPAGNISTRPEGFAPNRFPGRVVFYQHPSFRQVYITKGYRAIIESGDVSITCLIEGHVIDDIIFRSAPMLGPLYPLGKSG